MLKIANPTISAFGGTEAVKRGPSQFGAEPRPQPKDYRTFRFFFIQERPERGAQYEAVSKICRASLSVALQVGSST